MAPRRDRALAGSRTPFLNRGAHVQINPYLDFNGNCEEAFNFGVNTGENACHT